MNKARNLRYRSPRLAVLHKTAGRELADLVFHDLAGWLMMPLALGMLWAEVRLLSWILLPVPAREAAPQALDWWGAPGAKPAASRSEAGVNAAV